MTSLVTVEIARVSDGLMRAMRDELVLDDDGKPDAWVWSDGNYQCDCNRQIFFERAGGSAVDSLVHFECGDSRYLVRVMLDDGTVLYDEMVP